jgi:hypothetical protein
MARLALAELIGDFSLQDVVRAPVGYRVFR